jgi:hypothetical protein
MGAYVHDDFAGFQAGKLATQESRPFYRLKPTGSRESD